jgi:hypothetical protein
MGAERSLLQPQLQTQHKRLCGSQKQFGRTGEQENISGPVGNRIQTAAGSCTEWRIPFLLNTGTYIPNSTVLQSKQQSILADV